MSALHINFDPFNPPDAAQAAMSAMSWQRFKELLGFGDPCRNGGRRVAGLCQCPKYFAGRLCEYIICWNNGTPLADNTSCDCPDPHIRGRFCETIDCDNGGTANDAGYCNCPYNWYSGRFCQEYSTPWGIVLGVAITVVIVLIILYIVCRLDICQWICCKSDTESDIDESAPPAVNRQLSRRLSWRRRDRTLRRTSSPNQGSNRRRPPSFQLHSRISEDASVRPETRVALLFLQPDLKPPDYLPEEPPPPYEVVVRQLPAPNAAASPSRQREQRSRCDPNGEVTSV